MGKSLNCRDAGADCDWEARAETEEELMQQVALHAAEAHGMSDVPEEMIEKVRAAIKDE